MEGWESAYRLPREEAGPGACGSRGRRRGRRGARGRGGAGRRAAVTQGGPFKPKEGNAAAPREAGVGVAIAWRGWRRGRGSSPVLQRQPPRSSPARRPRGGGRPGSPGGQERGTPGVCGLAGLRASPAPRPLSPCFPGSGTREAP